ncbi:MAG: hypothetical protein NVS2B8_08860 [Vulcanimicrobiaceae bacterium]
MLNGRPIHPLLKLALVLAIGYVVVGPLVHVALLPVTLALVGWGGYQIYKAERRAGPRAPSPRPRPPTLRLIKRPPTRVKSVRFDPNEDLKVPKDWR